VQFLPKRWTALNIKGCAHQKAEVLHVKLSTAISGYKERRTVISLKPNYSKHFVLETGALKYSPRLKHVFCSSPKYNTYNRELRLTRAANHVGNHVRKWLTCKNERINYQYFKLAITEQSYREKYVMFIRAWRHTSKHYYTLAPDGGNWSVGHARNTYLLAQFHSTR
jgi:hypothetical protein